MEAMYDILGEWWPLLSAPEEYEEEAAFFRELLVAHCARPLRTVLELGAGGGNNAFHLKAHFKMTLVDLSPAMLVHSRKLNPECEHLEGDMRTLRLNRAFDAVFIHDAVMHMTTEADLRAAISTAFVHCAPGGVAVFSPDCVRETFAPGSSFGGNDKDGDGVRYVEWSPAQNPGDDRFVTDYVIMVREKGKDLRVVHDRHINGIFRRDAWLRLLRAAGFAPSIIPDAWDRENLIGKRPA